MSRRASRHLCAAAARPGGIGAPTKTALSSGSPLDSAASLGGSGEQPRNPAQLATDRVVLDSADPPWCRHPGDYHGQVMQQQQQQQQSASAVDPAHGTTRDDPVSAGAVSEWAAEVSQDHLLRAIEAAGVFVWHWDLRQDRVARKGDYTQLLGLDGGALPPTPHGFLAYVHAGDRPRVSTALQRAISTAGSYEHEFRVVRSDGRLRRLLARGQVLVGTDGAAEHLVGVMLDVTDQLGADHLAADMFERHPEPFVSIDRQLRFSHVNPAAEGMLGRSSETLVGRDVDIVAGALGAQFRRRCEQVLLERRPVHGESYAGAPGHRVEMSGYPDSQGVSVFLRPAEPAGGGPGWGAPGPPRMPRIERPARSAEAVARDAGRGAADRIQNAFADIAATVADARSLKCTLDTIAKVVVDATELAACAIVLFDGEPPQARVAGASGLPADYPRAYAVASRSGRRLPSMEAYQTGRAVLVRGTRQHPLLDGLADQTWSMLLCLPLVVRESSIGVIKMFYPEEWRPDEADLRFLRAVADQVAVAVNTARLSADVSEAAVSRERQRLARELHDSVTQSLFSMTLLAHASSRRLRRTGGDPTGELTETLTDLENLSTSALAEMRALLFELRPQTLSGRNLVDALQAQADTLQDRHGLLVDIRVANWQQPSARVEGELFRISVEALANVVRHAAATRGEISLCCTAEACVLTIVDDGVGFDVTTPRPGHLGLETMAERAERIGARLDLDSAPGRGTRVSVTVPAAGPGMTR